jgi:hypothetical protein
MQLSLFGMEQRYPRDYYDNAAMGPDLNGGLGAEASAFPTVPGTPSAHKAEVLVPETSDAGTPQHEGQHSPYKYDPSSPYWGHLDQASLAMMGIMTPQGLASAHTPSNKPRPSNVGVADDGEVPTGGHMNAQPLLLRQHQYTSYGALYANRDGYAAPSPATQFMMSPQSNFGYGYGAYGGFSPTRTDAHREMVHSPMAVIPVPLATPSKRQAADLEEKKNGD